MDAPPKPATVANRTLRFVLALGVVLALGGGLAAYLRLRTVPTPPDIPIEGIDPDIAAAVTLARQKVLDDPHSAEAWGFLGKVLLSNNLNNEAEICLRQTEKLDGKNPRWPYYLGLAQSHQTKVEEAIASIRRAVECGDRFELGVNAPRMQLITLLLQEGRNDEADEVLQVVRAREPGNPQTIFLTALLRANRNDLEGSVALLRPLTEHPSARKKACTKLVQLLPRLGDSKSAQKWETMARSLPDDALFADPYAAELRKYWVGRDQRFAEVARLEEQKRHGEAVAMLQRMIEGSERTVSRAHISLGRNLVHLARGPEAERAFENALRLVPNDAETYNYLAAVRLFQAEESEARYGDHEGARAHYRRALESARKAVEISPSLGEAQMTLGQILLALGDRRGGIAALKKCLESRPRMAHAHLLLGEALAKEGQLAEARNHLRDALRFADKDVERVKTALERFEKEHGKAPAGPGKEVPVPEPTSAADEVK